MDLKHKPALGMGPRVLHHNHRVAWADLEGGPDTEDHRVGPSQVHSHWPLLTSDVSEG